MRGQTNMTLATKVGLFTQVFTLVLMAQDTQLIGPNVRILPKSDGSAPASLRLSTATGGKYIGFKAPDTTDGASYVFQLPSASVGCWNSDGDYVITLIPCGWDHVVTRSITVQAGHANPFDLGTKDIPLRYGFFESSVGAGKLELYPADPVGTRHLNGNYQSLWVLDDSITKQMFFDDDAGNHMLQLNRVFGSTIVDTAGFDMHVKPTSNETRDLGSASFRWRKLYVKDIDVSGVIIGPTWDHTIYQSVVVNPGTSNANANLFDLASKTTPLHYGFFESALGTTKMEIYNLDPTGLLHLNSNPMTITANVQGSTSKQMFFTDDAGGIMLQMNRVLGGTAVNTAAFDMNVNPQTSVARDLGSSSSRWKKLYIQDLDITGTVTGSIWDHTIYRSVGVNPGTSNANANMFDLASKSVPLHYGFFESALGTTKLEIYNLDPTGLIHLNSNPMTLTSNVSSISKQMFFTDDAGGIMLQLNRIVGSTAVNTAAFDLSVIPASNETRDLGTSSSRWRKLYVKDLDVTGTVTGVSWDHVIRQSVTVNPGTSNANANIFDLATKAIPMHYGFFESALGTTKMEIYNLDPTGLIHLNSNPMTITANVQSSISKQMFFTDDAGGIMLQLNRVVGGTTVDNAAFGMNVSPSDTGITRDLGSSSYRWRKLYVKDIDCTGTCGSSTGGASVSLNAKTDCGMTYDGTDESSKLTTCISSAYNGGATSVWISFPPGTVGMCNAVINNASVSGGPMRDYVRLEGAGIGNNAATSYGVAGGGGTNFKYVCSSGSQPNAFVLKFQGQADASYSVHRFFGVNVSNINFDANHMAGTGLVLSQVMNPIVNNISISNHIGASIIATGTGYPCSQGTTQFGSLSNIFSYGEGPNHYVLKMESDPCSLSISKVWGGYGGMVHGIYMTPSTGIGADSIWLSDIEVNLGAGAAAISNLTSNPSHTIQCTGGNCYYNSTVDNGLDAPMDGVFLTGASNSALNGSFKANRVNGGVFGITVPGIADGYYTATAYKSALHICVGCSQVYVSGFISTTGLTRDDTTGGIQAFVSGLYSWEGNDNSYAKAPGFAAIDVNGNMYNMRTRTDLGMGVGTNLNFRTADDSAYVPMLKLGSDGGSIISTGVNHKGTIGGSSMYFGDIYVDTVHCTTCGGGMPANWNTLSGQVGNGSPAGYSLWIAQQTNNFIVLDSYSSTNTDINSLVFRRSGWGGTPAAPIAVANGMALGSVVARGYDGAGWIGSQVGGMSMVASEQWTSSNHGTYVQFSATGNGASTAVHAKVTGNGFEPGLSSDNLGLAGNTSTYWNTGYIHNLVTGNVVSGLNPNSSIFNVGYFSASYPTSNNMIVLDTYSSAYSSVIQGRRAHLDISNNLSAVTVGDSLLAIQGRGWDGFQFAGNTGAQIAMLANENYAGGYNHGADIYFATMTPTGEDYNYRLVLSGSYDSTRTPAHIGSLRPYYNYAGGSSSTDLGAPSYMFNKGYINELHVNSCVGCGGGSGTWNGGTVTGSVFFSGTVQFNGAIASSGGSYLPTGLMASCPNGSFVYNLNVYYGLVLSYGCAGLSSIPYNLIPPDNTYSLGSSSNYWKEGYINTLDVAANLIIPANNSILTACSGAFTGQMKYMVTQARLYICDGSNWRYLNVN